jgi:hypothetical protein
MPISFFELNRQNQSLQNELSAYQKMVKTGIWIVGILISGFGFFDMVKEHLKKWVG